MNRRRLRLPWLLPIALIVFLVASDLAGWSYLRRPVQSVLSNVLDREVTIGTPFRFHLRPRIPVEIGSLTIAAPEWSDAPHLVSLKGLSGAVGWGALLGRTPWLPRLAIEELDVHAQRDEQGRATWQFGPEEEKKDDEEAPRLPQVDRLEVGRATIAVADAPTGLDLDVEASTREGDADQAGDDSGFVAKGEGHWNQEPVAFEVKTPGLLKVLAGGTLEEIDLRARIARTEASFRGSIADLPSAGEVTGEVTLRGPSLAALGFIPNLTLPNTPSYELEGHVERTGETVKVKVSKAEIGSSSLTADLEYDAAPDPPLLRGTLNASRFVLQDLGPALGTDTSDDAPEARTKGGGKKGEGKKGEGKKGEGKKGEGTKGEGEEEEASERVLPAREFDVPRLRAMNADVLVDLRRVDLGTEALRPLSAVRGNLRLDGGRLQLDDLHAQLAEGSVAGTAKLDASQEDSDPRFDIRLRWTEVNLRSWVQAGEDFLVAGRFSGRTDFSGRGRSTASILGTLDGGVKGRIEGGAISHQLIELAGLDVGDALGVFVSGDKPLELTCGLVDLSAEKGRLRSNLFVLDTRDTLFFLQGVADLGDERLDLRLVQSPKDWSPLSLRAPVLVRGTLGDPEVGVEAAPIALKVLSSVVAGAVAPIAALIPLFEAKDNEEQRDGCGPAVEQVNRKAAELREKGRGEPGRAESREAAGDGDEASPKSGQAAAANRGVVRPADEGMPQASPGGRRSANDPRTRSGQP
jgi:uncharacterized protein involved in outer membrane biogenesis